MVEQKEELKTLKDIKTPADFADISSLEVRQEAIREIKELRKLMYSEKEHPNIHKIFPWVPINITYEIKDWRGRLFDISLYIKWKNNITDKDLR